MPICKKCQTEQIGYLPVLATKKRQTLVSLSFRFVWIILADLFYRQDKVQYFVATVDGDNATVVLCKFHLDSLCIDNFQTIVDIACVVSATDIFAR